MTRKGLKAWIYESTEATAALDLFLNILLTLTILKLSSILLNNSKALLVISFVSLTVPPNRKILLYTLPMPANIGMLDSYSMSLV